MPADNYHLLDLLKEEFDNTFNSNELPKSSFSKGFKMKYVDFIYGFNEKINDLELKERDLVFIQGWSEYLQGRISILKEINAQKSIALLIDIHISFLKELNTLYSRSATIPSNRVKLDDQTSKLSLNQIVLFIQLLRKSNLFKDNISNSELADRFAALTGYSNNTIRQKLSHPEDSFDKKDSNAIYEILLKLSERINTSTSK